MSTAAFEPNPPAPTPAPLIGRTVSLLVLLALVDFWCVRHLGFGMTDPVWLGSLAGSLTAAAGILEFIAPDRDKTTIPGKVRKAARVLLSPKLQAVLYLVAIALGASISSVVVLPDADSRGVVRLTPSGAETRSWTVEPDGPSARFLVTTNPFGRTVELSLDGYQTASLDVFPLVGTIVRPGMNLAPSPTLFIRPHWKALRSLDNEGYLKVTTADGTVIVTDQGSRSSFMIGRRQPLPPGAFGIWGLELSVEPETADNTRARTILEWSKPKLLKPAVELEPGMTLIARVESRTGVPIAEATIELGRDRLVDVPLLLTTRDE